MAEAGEFLVNRLVDLAKENIRQEQRIEELENEVKRLETQFAAVSATLQAYMDAPVYRVHV